MNTIASELYLDKLGLKREEPELGFLTKLIKAHQRTISFNNLWVYFRPGEILQLDLPFLLQKVIIEGGGGYCFENNKVFFYLLESLGFEVSAKACRVIYDKTGDVPRTHRTTLVRLDGKRYLVDVGFGKDVPPKPIPLGEEVSEGHQVIMKDQSYYHQLVKKDSLINLYVFDDGNYQESDFTLANYYTNTHPDSRFVRELIISRKEDDLLEFIHGRKFSRIKNDIREEREIKDQEDFNQLLKHFGIQHNFDFKFLEQKEK